MGVPDFQTYAPVKLKHIIITLHNDKKDGNKELQ